MAEDSLSAIEAVRRLIEESDRAAREGWEQATNAVASVGASPTDVQVCFLEGLVAHPAEAARFLEDPIGYSREAGIILDPVLVRDILLTVVFGEDTRALENRLSPGALRDIVGLRERAHACVIQGATSATLSAMGAVTTAAATGEELSKLKGLGEQGVRLPGGRTLRLPADLRPNTVVAKNLVAVYGATTVAVVARSSGVAGKGRRK